MQRTLTCPHCKYDLSAHFAAAQDEDRANADAGDRRTCPECGREVTADMMNLAQARRAAGKACIIWLVAMLALAGLLFLLGDQLAGGLLHRWMRGAWGDEVATRVSDWTFLISPIVWSAIVLLATWRCKRRLMRAGALVRASVVHVVGLLLGVLGGLAWLGYGLLYVAMRGFQS